jgi:hypothetical protein
MNFGIDFSSFIERNSDSQSKVKGLFDQMKEILNHHAPEEEPKYDSRGILPMVSVDQAAKELLELFKNETNNCQ